MKLLETIRTFLALPLLLAVAAISAGAHADVVVIVSAKSPVTRLTDEQIAKIFLGKTNRFPDDRDAVPIDQAVDSAIRDEFYSRIAHKNSAQLSAYWAKVIFTGEGHPPVILKNNLAVRKAVASDPNAIGYIDKKTVNRSVRVILDVKKK